MYSLADLSPAAFNLVSTNAFWDDSSAMVILCMGSSSFSVSLNSLTSLVNLSLVWVRRSSHFRDSAYDVSDCHPPLDSRSLS